MKRILLALAVSVGATVAAGAAPVGTAFTYQGQLKRGGAAYNGTCNLQYSVWDAPAGGAEQGAVQSINDVTIVDGVFTVAVDVGGQFSGNAAWLQIGVQCSEDSGFTTLEPRQAITPTPYALSLRPGALIVDLDTASKKIALTTLSASASGVGLSASGGRGIVASSTFAGGIGVLASGTARGVSGDSFGADGVGVEGFGGPAAKAGVFGSTGNKNGSGVYGVGNGGSSAGVFALNTDSAAIWGRTTGAGSAVYGESTGGGLAGKFVGRVLVEGPVSGQTTGFQAGVTGLGDAGVRGVSTTSEGAGVIGIGGGQNSAGVYGQNIESAAIWGKSTGGGSAVYGENTAGGFAGRFKGPVIVEGTLSKSAGAFKIDHPLDPANRFLSHSFVESPDMKNIYDGVVVLDAAGQAVVQLPDYFEALNRDYRYQLTCVGGVAPVYVAQKVSQNQFRIAGGTPGLEVSWQVTGIRRDAYAEENRIVVDEAKRPEEQGFYLYPAGFGAGEERRINRMQRGADEPPVEEPHGAATTIKPRP